VPDRGTEGEGRILAEIASGSLPPSSPSCRRQKAKFAKIFGLQKKISSRPFFSPGRFEEKERRGKMQKG
jgi:hypothetical protein